MRDFVAELKRIPQPKKWTDIGLADFERLPAGKFWASIQASRTHYSTPRALLPSADSYSAFEVAIFDKDDKWVVPPRDDRFKAKPWAALFEDSNSTSVAGYVPCETVAQILADLEATP
jgi:hypothetical protein